MQTEITVLGGLPVTVEFNILTAEPDVGIMSDYIDEWSITEVASKPSKKSLDWLYKLIGDVEGEEDRIVEACFNAVQDAREEYEIERF